MGINLPSDLRWLINFISRKNVVLLSLLLLQVLSISFSYASSIAVESALRRSRVEAELAASRAASEAALRRSRIEAEVATESALRRSRIEAEVAAERIATDNALRRSRLAAELAASRLESEAALRRSRVAAEIEADRIASENALRRSRIEAEIAAERIAAESALRRSRVEAEVLAESALRRSRVEAELSLLRSRRLYYPYIWWTSFLYLNCHISISISPSSLSWRWQNSALTPLHNRFRCFFNIFNFFCWLDRPSSFLLLLELFILKFLLNIFFQKTDLIIFESYLNFMLALKRLKSLSWRKRNRVYSIVVLCF